MDQLLKVFNKIVASKVNRECKSDFCVFPLEKITDKDKDFVVFLVAWGLKHFNSWDQFLTDFNSKFQLQLTMRPTPTKKLIWKIPKQD